MGFIQNRSLLCKPKDSESGDHHKSIVLSNQSWIWRLAHPLQEISECTSGVFLVLLV